MDFRRRGRNRLLLCNNDGNKEHDGECDPHACQVRMKRIVHKHTPSFLGAIVMPPTLLMTPCRAEAMNAIAVVSPDPSCIDEDPCPDATAAGGSHAESAHQ